VKEAVVAHDTVEAVRSKEELDVRRDRQLKQTKARAELVSKIGEETDKRIEEMNKDQKSKGKKWFSRLQYSVGASYYADRKYHLAYGRSTNWTSVGGAAL
jgi:hypothetical protein